MRKRELASDGNDPLGASPLPLHHYLHQTDVHENKQREKAGGISEHELCQI